MMKSPYAWLLMLCLAPMIGCSNDDKENNQNQTGNQQENDDDENEKGHHHDDHGPNGGEVVELGSDKFHAELGHDHGAKTVTVWILDGEAKKNVAIEAEEIQVVIDHDGTKERMTLKAAKLETEKEGTSSRFASDDAELFEHVHDGDEITILVNFKEDGEDKQLRGTHKGAGEHKAHDH